MTNMAKAVQEIMAPIAEDLLAVDREITTDLKSDIELIQRISDYIVSAGGKRVRPMVLMLLARAMGYQGQEHVFLATMIEYVHTASLLHDDVVDESDVRRGKPTASFKWGNASAILVGDYMYSRAFQLMVKTKNLRVCEIVAKAVNDVSEGEVIQLLNIHDTTVNEDRYFQVIERKTGVLFEAAARLAATVANATPEEEQRVADYALALGKAFQIVDDILDYAGTPEKIGKALGGDLREGKMTMPLIYALRLCNSEDAEIIREAIRQGDGDLDRIINIVNNCGAIELCKETARKVVEEGIEKISFLPASNFKNSLIQLLSLVIDRDI